MKLLLLVLFICLSNSLVSSLKVYNKYDATYYYKKGDLVEFNGKNYRALFNNVNEEVDKSFGAWEEIPDDHDGYPVWHSSRFFKKGEIVYHDGILYKSLFSKIGVCPSNDTLYWKKIGTIRDIFENIDYNIGLIAINIIIVNVIVCFISMILTGNKCICGMSQICLIGLIFFISNMNHGYDI